MKPAPPPIPSAQRGPKWLATQPTIGAPIGVPPSAMPTRRAITLPRIAGSVESCMMLFVPLREGQDSRADNHESRREPPVSRRQCGQGTAKPEDTSSHQKRRQAWFLPTGSKQGS